MAWVSIVLDAKALKVHGLFSSNDVSFFNKVQLKFSFTFQFYEALRFLGCFSFNFILSLIFVSLFFFLVFQFSNFVSLLLLLMPIFKAKWPWKIFSNVVSLLMLLISIFKAKWPWKRNKVITWKKFQLWSKILICFQLEGKNLATPFEDSNSRNILNQKFKKYSNS